MKAQRIRVDYLTAPLGLGNPTPRFYWNCSGGKRQTAYEILCTRNGKIIWDSGKVESSSMTHIPYEGEALHSRDEIVVRIMLWDENDEPGEATDSSFEMGLLEPSDWVAKWISGNYKANAKRRYPVDYFKKEFVTEGAAIERVRYYGSACGVYDLWIDKKKVEDFYLAPGMTDYRKRLQYQTYDVTDLFLQEKGNAETPHVMELRLGDGWSRGCVAAYSVRNVFGDTTSVMGQLEITYKDGSRQVVATDESFLWCNNGPIRFADLKDGEVYDASFVPDYKEVAKVIESPKAILCASDNVYVKEQEHFKAKAVSVLPNKKVFDFGQNMAGILSFKVKGAADQVLRFVCGEQLDADGNVDLSSISEEVPKKGWTGMKLVKKLMTQKVSGETELSPKQEVTIICNGEDISFKNSFSVFGFRYVQVESDDEFELLENQVEAIAVYSDLKTVGHFECSSGKINQLVNNTLWSMKSNFLDLPTDCPTRERLGWTGDAQIFFDTGAYFMDTSAFFSKWLRDMEDNQYDNGCISAVIPYSGVEMMYKSTGVSVGWADAVYLIPYRYYLRYGDKKLLETYYPMMKKYTEYLRKNLGMKDKKEAKDNPYNAYTYEKGVHLGEWLEPKEFKDEKMGAGVKHPEECTAYLYLTLTTMAKIAKILEDYDYRDELLEVANGAKKAYHHLFIKNESYVGMRQAKQVRPLALGVLDGDAYKTDKKKVQDALVKAVADYNYQVGTGFLSTPFLLDELTKAGHLDMAYQVLENEQGNGWLSEVKAGATTIWENWEGDLSLNHYSPGAVCQWLFDTVCGIRMDGENHFIISPRPGGSLTYAKATYESIYGTVSVEWEKKEDGYHYDVQLPPNVTADIITNED